MKLAPHFVGIKEDGSFHDISVSSKSTPLSTYPKTPNEKITEENLFVLSNDMTLHSCNTSKYHQQDNAMSYSS